MSQRRRTLQQRFPNIHLAGFMTQPYDPEKVSIDQGEVNVISRARRQSGFGAPPIVPYGQTTLPNFGIRDRLAEMFPILKQWLPAKKT